MVSDVRPSWSNAGMIKVSQHCANIGLLDKTMLAQHWLANVGPMFLVTLANQWYLMLGLHWSNAGMMKVSQVVPMLARWTKLRWPNIDCQCWANVSAYIGPALAQCLCVIWVSTYMRSNFRSYLPFLEYLNF